MEVFEVWNDVPKEILKQINSALCCGAFSPNSSTKEEVWSFNFPINCWEYDRFLTLAQWAKIAQLCAYHGVDSIREAIEGLVFETKYVKVGDTIYKIPTNAVGRIGSTYFLIEPDGRAHS